MHFSLRLSASRVLLAASLLLSGACGNKSPNARESASQQQADSQPPPPEQTKPVTEKVHSGPVIVAFGDSLTAGVAGRSYPDQLQDLLDSSHLEYRVENQGVSGDTTTDGLARIDNVLAAKPALVILEFGGNDGLRGTPVDSIRRNLETMIGRIQAAKIPLVLLGITLPPNYGPDYVKSFTAMYPALAKQFRIQLIPFLLQHVYQDSAMMQPDGIHPNGAGNRIVAQDVFNLIAPVLKNLNGKG